MVAALQAAALLAQLCIRGARGKGVAGSAAARIAASVLVRSAISNGGQGSMAALVLDLAAGRAAGRK